VVFEHARYSVPARYVGQIVEVRGGARSVRIHHDGAPIKVHLPAGPGETRTDTLDFPDAKRYFLEHPPAACQARAEAIGEGCARFVAQALAPGTTTGLRKAQKVLRLAERHGDAALEAACKRAASYENWHIASLEALLKRGGEPAARDADPIEPAPPPAALPAGFARSASYFVHAPVGKEGAEASEASA
jgi:hypothetical protein